MSRTRPPLTTMIPSSTSAATQMLRNSPGVKPSERTRRMSSRRRVMKWRLGARRVVEPNPAMATVRAVLTSYDDFPIHQASVPVAHSATGDVNQYDRYFFNG